MVKAVSGWNRLPAKGIPASNQTLNGGWCWVHVPDSPPKCVAFFKTFSEQTHEPVLLDNLWVSPCNVRIEFNDVDLFPLICADILCEKDDNAIKRIGEYAESKEETEKKPLLSEVCSNRKRAMKRGGVAW